MNSFRALVAFFAVALCSAPLQAALVAYEGFEGYVGNLDAENGGTGWSAPWTTGANLGVVSASLSYSGGSVVVLGGSLSGAGLDSVGGSATGVPAGSRPFATETGTVYFSFLFQVQAGLNTDDFLQFMLNNDTITTDSGSIGKVNTGSQNLGARVGTTNGGDATDSGTTIVPGTTYFIVGKVSKTGANYGRTDLFVNPTSQIEPGTASATDTATSGFSDIDFFVIRGANMDSGDIFLFDELRIGTTFADVVPVPEPATWCLVALGAVTLLVVQRRRRSGSHLRRTS